MLDYLGVFGANLAGVVLMGALFGLEEVARRFDLRTVKAWLDKIPAARRRRLEYAGLFFAVFYAGYAAWSEEHKARVAAEARSPMEMQRQLEELRAELAARGTSRAITEVQRSAIAKIAQQASPSTPTIELTYAMGCLDCANYADDIDVAFQMGGWKSSKAIRLAGHPRDLPPLVFYVPNPDAPFKLALIAAAALDAASIRYGWAKGGSDSVDTVHLLIGPK